MQSLRDSFHRKISFVLEENGDGFIKPRKLKIEYICPFWSLVYRLDRCVVAGED